MVIKRLLTCTRVYVHTHIYFRSCFFLQLYIHFLLSLFFLFMLEYMYGVFILFLLFLFAHLRNQRLALILVSFYGFLWAVLNVCLLFVTLNYSL